MRKKRVHVLELPVRSIAEFIETVKELRKKWCDKRLLDEIWFRGVKDKTLSLLPGAYWRAECDEYSMVLSFRNMVPSLFAREPSDDWEWYYLMQHYGLPTRLLDWTESPLFALYFALAEDGDKSPCVWVLDPVALNRTAQGPEQEAIIVPLATDRDAPTRHWLPEVCGRGKPTYRFASGSQFETNENPLAVFPKRYNPRIVAQRGVFTIHGSKEVPLEEIMCSAASDGEPRIVKLTFRKSARSRLRDEIWSLGVTKAALFPEPQSVAEDLKKAYGVK